MTGLIFFEFWTSPFFFFSVHCSIIWRISRFLIWIFLILWRNSFKYFHYSFLVLDFFSLWPSVWNIICSLVLFHFRVVWKVLFWDSELWNFYVCFVWFHIIMICLVIANASYSSQTNASYRFLWFVNTNAAHHFLLSLRRLIIFFAIFR